MRWTFSFVLFALATLGTGFAARAEGAEHATEPRIQPTALWFLTQMVPSPEVAAGSTGAHFGLRWQVTPLLYSWGINRKLSPWRVLVSEPLVRHSGSMEIYISPEYIDTSGSFGEKWLLRPGVRAYFPLVQHGDNLSVSIGTSYQRFQGRSSAAFEAGAYVLYGIFGLQLSYAPAPNQPIATIATLRFRYF